MYTDRQLAWRTLRVHRSTIATMLQHPQDNTIGSDKRVSLLMRVAYLTRPPASKFNPIWDVSSVLRCIEAWGDVSTWPRPRLTHRLVMLLALASARRVSDLYLLRIDSDHLQKLPSKWSFITAFGAKQERTSHSVPPIISTKNIECPNLCPIAHLKEYLTRTKIERKGSRTPDHLFWTTVVPFRPAAKTTIASWLVLALKEAGTSDSAGSTTKTFASNPNYIKFHYIIDRLYV